MRPERTSQVGPGEQHNCGPDKHLKWPRKGHPKYSPYGHRMLRSRLVADLQQASLGFIAEFYFLGLVLISVLSDPIYVLVSVFSKNFLPKS